jgi:autotransporter-associated beta strand protein
MLSNPGFEDPVLAPNTDMPMQSTPGGTPTASWYGWNNETAPYSAYYDDNITPHSGNQVGKTYGGMTYSGNGPNAGIFQPVASTPGDSYTASGWYVNSSVNGGADQLNNNETDDCRIFFDSGANGTGTTVGNTFISPTLTELSPTDVWTQLSTVGVAPAGTQSVVWMAFYSCPVEFAAGALYVDDAYLGYSPLTWNNSGGTGDGASWDVNTNQNWTDGTNEALFPNGAPVTFNDNNSGHYSVNITSTVQPWSTTFNATGNYALSGIGGIGGTGSLTQSGSGTVTLATANSYTGGTFVTNGKLKIAPTSPTTSALPIGPLSISGGGVVQLADNVTAGTPLGASNVVLTSLSITGNSTLDIGNNRIIIDYSSPATDPIASIATWIHNGFYDVPGPQIISSDIASANTASGHSYGIGYADGADGAVAGLPSGEIEIMFTLLGDANLDGTVNSEDFTPFSTNLGLSGGWDKGDFNYDGTVNSEDFTPFSSNLNQSASLAAAAGSFEAADGLSLANVPEPACGTLLLAGAASLLRRRSRKRFGSA